MSIDLQVRFPPIAVAREVAHNRAMVSIRSPWFPLACGAAFLVLTIAAWTLGGALVGSVLLTLSLPLIFEGVAWYGAAKIGRSFYDLDERVIHSEAYDPRALLVRYAIICGLLLSILIGREAKALPDSFVGWLSLVVAALLWLAFVLRSYARQITNLARRKHVPINRSAGDEGP